jgi:uncharacterized protein YlzI (FlbEa/FlbD family)
MIKLTKVVAELTEDAEKRMVLFEDQQDSNLIKPAVKDEHGHTMTYYEDLNIKIPDFFYEKGNLPPTTIDLTDEDYTMSYFTLFIESENIESLENAERYTLITMKNGAIWAVEESASKVMRKIKKYLEKSK